MTTDDLFRARLDGMVDPRNPLAVLGRRMPWPQIEASLAPLFACKARMGKSREDADMCGPTLVAAGGFSGAGRPRLPIRLMVSLLYLEHAFNKSDESVVERWSENVVWQLFSGMEYYQSKLPCDATAVWGASHRRSWRSAIAARTRHHRLQAKRSSNLQPGLPPWWYGGRGQVRTTGIRCSLRDFLNSQPLRGSAAGSLTD